MKLFDKKGTVYRAIAGKSPKKKNKLGRPWLSFMIKIDDEPVQMYLEEFYGKRYHFNLYGKWYSILASKHEGGIGDPIFVKHLYTQMWRRRHELSKL